LTVAGNSWLGGGTVTSTSGTLTFTGAVSSTGSLGSGTGNMLLSSTLQNNGTLDVGSGNVTTTGNATSTGTINGRTGTVRVSGNWADSGTLNGGTGTFEFNGTGAQTIGAESGFNKLTINKSAGTATLAGSVTSSQLTMTTGTLDLSSRTLTLTGAGTGGSRPFVKSSGTFTPSTSLVKFTGSASSDIEPTVYNNIQFSGAGPYNLTASSTAVGTTVNNSGSTLAVGTNSFTARGLISNDGLITEGSGGKVVHTFESITFTDASGVAVTGYTGPVNVYITLQDSNRNLNGAAVETILATTTLATDTEIVILTETGSNTGIFRNTAGSLTLRAAVTVLPGNGNLDILTTGTGAGSYVDAQDAADTASASISMVYGTATVSSSGGGGGVSSGGGSSGSAAAAPATVTKPTVPTPTPAPPVPKPVTPTPVVPAPVAPPSAPTVTPSAPAAPAAISISKLSAVPTVVAGKALTFSYAYKNSGKRSITVEVVRELIDAQGKIIRTSKGRAVIKSQATYQRAVTEQITTMAKPGSYKEGIKIIDSTSKKVLAQQEVKFTVTLKATVNPGPPQKPVAKKAPVKVKVKVKVKVQSP